MTIKVVLIVQVVILHSPNVFQGTYVNEAESEHSIPFSDNETDKEEVKQFVKFEIQNVLRTSSN